MSGFENSKVENKKVDYSSVVVSSDAVGVYSNSVMSNADVEEVSFEQDVVPYDFIGPLAPGQVRGEQPPKLEIASNDWIFGGKSLETNQFGGYQGSLRDNYEKYMNDPKIDEIINKYYPNISNEDKELLFQKMNRIGCGYIAHTNALFIEFLFKGESEFQKEFGFRPYDLAYDENGKLYKVFNYDYLFLDFFLYIAKRKGFESIEDVYGNISEELELFGSNDGALDEKKENFEATGMEGLGQFNNLKIQFAQDWEEYYEDYAKEKGLDVTLKFDQRALEIDKTQDYEKWEIKMREIYEWLVGLGYKEDYQYFLENDSDGWLAQYDIGVEAVEKIFRSGKQIIVSSSNFPLYSTIDENHNGKFDDVVVPNVGGHAMIVVGTTSDGKFIVSSWGKQYIMDPKDVKQIEVLDFHR